MTVALLHGFLGSPEVWRDIDGVAIALPGHGGDPVAPTWEANLDAVARAIVGCDVVVGYSLGARVAAGLVVRGAVPRAVLISGNPGISDAERPARRANDARWAARFRSEPLAAVLDAWEAQPLFATQVRFADPARRARRLALDPEQLAKSLEVMGLAEMPDYRTQIDSRFRLIVGALDAKYVAIARGLGAPVEEIAACGHDPTLEQPAELAAAIARALSPR